MKAMVALITLTAADSVVNRIDGVRCGDRSDGGIISSSDSGDSGGLGDGDDGSCGAAVTAVMVASFAVTTTSTVMVAMTKVMEPRQG